MPTSSGREETGIQQKEMKKQVEQLQEDLFKMETQKDELQSKLELAEKQVEESHTREVELQRMADQARALKVYCFAMFIFASRSLFHAVKN